MPDTVVDAQAEVFFHFLTEFFSIQGLYKVSAGAMVVRQKEQLNGEFLQIVFLGTRGN